MTQEELDRLDYLVNKGRWTLQELGERDRLFEQFYHAFRARITPEEPKTFFPHQGQK